MEKTNPAQAVIDFLNRTLEERKAQFPKYSLRALAEDLNVNPGILSASLSGNRKMTFDTATTWLKALNVDPAKLRQLLAQMSEDDARNFVNLTPEQSQNFQLMESAVMTLLRLRTKGLTVKALSEIFETDLAKMQTTIKHLCDLKLTQLNGDEVICLDQRLPRAHWDKATYKKVITDSHQLIEKTVVDKSEHVGVSASMTFVSSEAHLKANFGKFLHSLEDVHENFVNPQGDTVFLAQVFIGPVSKPVDAT